MAQIMGNKGLVISRDIYQHKLSLIGKTQEVRYRYFKGGKS